MPGRLVTFVPFFFLSLDKTSLFLNRDKMQLWARLLAVLCEEMEAFSALLCSACSVDQELSIGAMLNLPNDDPLIQFLLFHDPQT